MTCAFNASSSTDDGTIVLYSWILNKSPGNTAAGKVVNVLYPHGGNRTITLTVTDNGGKTSSITKVITIP